MSELSEALGANLKAFRQSAGATQSQLEAALGLGPGWIELYESGRELPSIDALMAILTQLEADARSFFRRTHLPHQQYPRALNRAAVGRDLLVSFPYGKFSASYTLPGASEEGFDSVLEVLRKGLAQSDRSSEDPATAQADAVASAFLRAAAEWPHANPSDLWYFVVYRAYLDRANHPASHARLDLAQSWKRTGGWALERVLVRHYGERLAAHGINISIPPKKVVALYLESLELADRLEPDKVDVVLTESGGSFLGVVHVKASFAERRTDDVPMSRALVEAGYFSPLWTMDCKAIPGERPANRGELGKAMNVGQPDKRSAKRKDIEDDAYFSACFSYNLNTQPTPSDQDTDSPILICDFRNEDDDFVTAAVSALR